MLETILGKLILEERRENIVQVLEARFEDLSKEVIRDKLNAITKRERLASLLKNAATVETLEEFKERLDRA